ncbi:unnamed protein product [Boreogadus saida]
MQGKEEDVTGDDGTKNSVSFLQGFVCQMVPWFLQLARRSCGHLDAALWSCEILQSPLPCEACTYYATE